MMKTALKSGCTACEGCCCSSDAGTGASGRRTLQAAGTDMAILAAGIVLFTAGFILRNYPAVSFILFFTSWLTAGYKVVFRSFANITKGRIFDENFLMTIATVGAFLTGQFGEAAAVMLFYKLGSILEEMAVNHSRRSITELMALRPEHANLKQGDEIIQIRPEEIKPGDILVVRPGERIPADSIIVDGSSLADTSPLTGESLPKAVGPGDQVLGGYINKTGLLTIRAESGLEQSAVARILELVEEAASRKAPMESFINRFAAYYTPVVTISALLIAVIPPLVTGRMDFMTWLYRAMIFLVISCPCALVVSIPLTFYAGIGKSSANGILVKGGNYLDALNRADTVVFDKTGTLTKGIFSVTGIRPHGCSEQELLRLAAYAEHNSTHPIARSILQAYGEDIDEAQIENSVETAGKGIRTSALGHDILAGNLEFIKSAIGTGSHGSTENASLSAAIPEYDDESAGTTVHIMSDGRYMGWIEVSDTLKDDAQKAVDRLRKNGIKKIAMLTGDSRVPAETAARELGLDEVGYGLLPHEKADRLEKIMSAANGHTIFVGDGINDAPVLASADIGVSMGGIGSDAAIEASDIVLMTDEPSRLADALKIAAITRKIAVQNIAFAISVKVLFLLLGALGLATMWEAVFSDVGVTVLAVLNTLRIRHY
ncbi:MAG TPA: heavy metal translocating P-type ATPase, partial [Clostridiales bacterium]|nr:heavy metal translocating P-type ATPase [Clostridiales bacterium]